MNNDLREELLSMQEEDERLMRELMDAGELKEDEYHPRIKPLHESNIARIEAVIRTRCERNSRVWRPAAE